VFELNTVTSRTSYLAHSAQLIDLGHFSLWYGMRGIFFHRRISISAFQRVHSEGQKQTKQFKRNKRKKERYQGASLTAFSFPWSWHLSYLSLVWLRLLFNFLPLLGLSRGQSMVGKG